MLKFQKLTTLACAGLLTLTYSAIAQNAKQSGASKTEAPSGLHEAVAAGTFENSLYRNPWFGFSCRVPYGWVDRTDEMREASKQADKATVLLGMFERPPEAAGSTVNSSIVIAAEAASEYPGIKSAAQYFGPLTEVTDAQGLTKVNEPYEFPVDGKPIVREDFIKQMGGVSLHQGTLAWLARGYIVSFTFIGGSDDEVQSLIEGLKIDYSHKSVSNKGKAAKP